MILHYKGLKLFRIDSFYLRLRSIAHTVNDKSFEGEKFLGLLSSSGRRGKVSRFFPSPPSYMSEHSEEQNFSRENFRGLIKIREKRESFLTVKVSHRETFIVYGMIICKL